MRATSADAVIVGGGVIGLACAEYLSRDGWQVVVLERLGLAAGASSACQSGIGIAPFASNYDLILDKAAISEYVALAADGAQVDYNQGGAMLVCEPHEAEKLQARLPHLRGLGFSCEWLDPQALREAEPVFSPTLGGAALLADVGTVSPMRLIVELARRVGERGSTILTNAELVGVELARGQVVAAQTTQGRIATTTLVLAAGAWSRAAGRLAGLRVPVWPLKGHVIVTEPLGGWVRHYTSEMGYEATVAKTLAANPSADAPPEMPPQIAAVLQPLPSGQMLIGSSREFAGFEREVNRERLAQVTRRACRLAPGLKNVRALRTYAGLRPWSPDGRALIGPTRQAPGVVLATGHAGHGNTQALITGRLVAELLGGRAPAVDPGPVSPDRFEMN